MGRRIVAFAILAAACTSSDPAAGDPETVAARSSLAANLDSLEAVQRAESLATAVDLWSLSEVISRLEEAGLVVRDLERPVSAAGFGITGTTLSVSGGELAVFIYPGATDRRSATGQLDSASAAPAGTDSVWQGRPRLITSGNLAAVLITDREQLAERVRNVLTARHGG